MSEYKGIKGFQVQTRTADPGPTEAQPGDFYYNSTTGQFKTVNTGGAPIGTWASGGSLNTSRSGSGGTGTSTSTLVFGGRDSGPGFSAANESYDGSSFTEVGDLNTGRRSLMSAGIANTAALAIGGYRPPGSVTNINESWDGSSWTEVADMATARTTAGAGTSAQSALAIGGYTGSFTAATEEFTAAEFEIKTVTTS